MGREDAERIGVAIRARIPAEAVVELHTSDVRRCRETAAAVGRQLDISRAVPAPGLREMSYGEAEGRPQAWLDELLLPPPALGERLRHDQGLRGAETRQAEQVRWVAVERVGPAVRRLPTSLMDEVDAALRLHLDL